ncbi:antifreeze protein type IV [Corythoichthys intestinalis]|uniref:antifreeze protein type IV n=1 Tax=Corythoichthys intestinalis TaxID=161448 RepID=UPI0025A58559|nr:antifreeze protein type IV [Corythoichthys intestinalis]XP_061808755.1 type-4 ice-structuring protein LS-12-like [Nerophis lumbriciformis]
MKFLIAALVVIALAQGSLAQEALDMDAITQKFEEIKNQVTLEMNKLINTQDLGSQAQTFLEEQKKQFEPLLTKVLDEIKAAAANAQEQIEPMTTSLQAQMQPMLQKAQEQIEAFVKDLTEKTKALTN